MEYVKLYFGRLVLMRASFTIALEEELQEER